VIPIQEATVRAAHRRAQEMERAGSCLQTQDLLRDQGGADLTNRGTVTLAEAQRQHIRRALDESRWIVAGPSGAAAKLGVKRTSLQYKMQKLGISRGR
jgi:formate hydrogenlyase transcriptional activator